MLLFAVATLICVIAYGPRSTLSLLFAVAGFSITAALIAMLFGTWNAAGAVVLLGATVLWVARRVADDVSPRSRLDSAARQ